MIRNERSNVLAVFFLSGKFISHVTKHFALYFYILIPYHFPWERENDTDPLALSEMTVMYPNKLMSPSRHSPEGYGSLSLNQPTFSSNSRHLFFSDAGFSGSPLSLPVLPWWGRGDSCPRFPSRPPDQEGRG